MERKCKLCGVPISFDFWMAWDGHCRKCGHERFQKQLRSASKMGKDHGNSLDNKNSVEENEDG